MTDYRMLFDTTGKRAWLAEVHFENGTNARALVTNDALTANLHCTIVSARATDLVPFISQPALDLMEKR